MLKLSCEVGGDREAPLVGAGGLRAGLKDGFLAAARLGVCGGNADQQERSQGGRESVGSEIHGGRGLNLGWSENEVDDDAIMVSSSTRTKAPESRMEKTVRKRNPYPKSAPNLLADGGREASIAAVDDATMPVACLQVLDSESLADAVKHANLSACQLSARPAPSMIARVLCPQARLEFAALGPAMLFTGAMPRDCFTLVFVLDCPSEGHSFNFAARHTAGYMGFPPPAAHWTRSRPKATRTPRSPCPKRPSMPRLNDISRTSRLESSSRVPACASG